MSSINNLPTHILTRPEPIQSTHETNQKWQLNKSQRKQASREHDRQAQERLNEQLKSSLFENQELDHANENSRNAWDKFLTHETRNAASAAKQALEEGELSAGLEQELLEQFSSRYLVQEEIESLWEYCDGDNEISQDEADGVAQDIMGSEEGGETAILENFLSKKQNKASPVSIYLLLNQIMAKMHKENSKRLFRRQLAEWLKTYENQENSVLFEFFDLVKNPNLKEQVQQHDLTKLAQLNSSKQSIATLKQSVDLIASTFDNQFDGLVSTFMKLKARQLTMLSHTHLNSEEKAHLYDLMRVEKNLIIVSSLYNKQNKFYEQLTKAKLQANEQIGDNPAQALHGTLNFCEANFISELTIDKLWKSWKVVPTSAHASIRLISELNNFISGLPLALFNNNNANVEKIIASLRSLFAKASPTQNTTVQKNGNTNNNGLSIINSRKKFPNYA